MVRTMDSASQGQTSFPDLPGYVIRDEFLAGLRTRIYRGWSVKNQVPVLIKTPKSQTASFPDVTSLFYEYEIARDLELEGIAKIIELVSVGTTLAIILEDTGAIPLAQYIGDKAVRIRDFLDIALHLVETLARLHQSGIVHRNISDESILVHPKTKRVAITGFAAESIAPQLKSFTELVHPAYIAPEQTGLGSYNVDHRSDYYSLGVVFYKMLTGQLPLQATSFSEWILVHATQEPTPPHEVNPKVPRALSHIVMRMLSKSPDERYQSSWGLIRDLRECGDRMNADDTTGSFGAGQSDLHPRFALSRKLVGRSEHAAILKRALDQASRGKGGIVLLAGEAGIGKTKLVNEVLRPLAIEKGYYGYGKAEQIKYHTPYATLVSALEMIIRQLITDSECNLAIWKKEILKAVGRNGAVITELLPDVEMIIGPQPQLEALSPKELQNRFFMVLGDFLSALAGRSAPLVLFLDDLQWIEVASLQLLRYLCLRLKCFLVVGAYRDNEVDESHPLTGFVQHVRGKTSVTELHLDPLSAEEVVEFVSDTFGCPSKEIQPLAAILERKTCGNPLFLGESLKAIYNENVVRLNEYTGYWEWKVDSVDSLKMPDSIVELILMRLNKIPKATLDLLKLASCLGHAFGLGSLSLIGQMTPSEASALLAPALKEGLVFPTSGESDNRSFEFSHDRVQQSVYSLFSQDEKKKVHLRIGRLMLTNVSSDDPDNVALPTMDHINRSLDLVDCPRERLLFADYNLRAGRKAKSSAAHDSALSYFRAGKELLPEDAWAQHYSLCYALHLECAQCEYMMGGSTEAENLLDILINHAKTELEKADIHSMRMVLYAETGDYGRALETGINTLSALGMPVPARPAALHYVKEVLLYKWLMLNRGVEYLINLPAISDEKQKKVTEVLVKFILVTCTNYPDLYAFTIIKAGNHAIRHGGSEMAPVGYLGFAITEGSVLGNYARGYELGKAALSVIERYGKSSARCIVYFTLGAIINHWTHHLGDGLEYLSRAVEYALRDGEVIVAGWAYGTILENKYLMGVSLDEVLEESKKCSEYAERVRHENLLLNARSYGLIASILRGWRFPSDDPWDNEDISNGDKASLAAHYFCQMQICYLRGDYTRAISIVEDELRGCLPAIMGFMLSAECNYYHSLIVAGMYPRVRSGERRRLIRCLQKNQRQMKRWSDSCPQNFLHKYCLVRAEHLRILGKNQEAEVFYDKAINSARDNGYLHDEAVACELAAVFAANRGRLNVARAYMSDACRLYRQWGATSKVHDLIVRYPELTDEGSDRDSRRRSTSNLVRSIPVDHTHGDTKDNQRDVGVDQELLQSVAGQTSPRKAIEAFLNAVASLTYANKAYLILEWEQKLTVHFARDSESGAMAILEPIPLDQADVLCKAIVRLAFRTLKPVIADEDQLAVLSKDPYLSTAKPKSIACIPLLAQGTPIGALYLENRFVPNIFTPEKLGQAELLANRLFLRRPLRRFLKKVAGDKSSVPSEVLTEREKEVLRLISRGLSNKEIADALDLTMNTVKTHIKNIYGKLQVTSRVQAVHRGQDLEVL
jgi:histidine kinase